MKTSILLILTISSTLISLINTEEYIRYEGNSSVIDWSFPFCTDENFTIISTMNLGSDLILHGIYTGVSLLPDVRQREDYSPIFVRLNHTHPDRNANIPELSYRVFNQNYSKFMPPVETNDQVEIGSYFNYLKEIL